MANGDIDITKLKEDKWYFSKLCRDNCLSLKTVKYCLEHGASLYDVDICKMSGLDYLVMNAFSSFTISLFHYLESIKVNFRMTYPDGKTMIHQICKTSAIRDVIINCLRYTDVLNKQDNEGNTPIHYIFKNYHICFHLFWLNQFKLGLNLIRKVFSRGGNFNITNNQGITPFYELCEKLHDGEHLFRVVRLCIERGADINVYPYTTTDTDFPLIHMICNNCVNIMDTVKLLESRGADFSKNNVHVYSSEGTPKKITPVDCILKWSPLIKLKLIKYCVKKGGTIRDEYLYWHHKTATKYLMKHKTIDKKIINNYLEQNSHARISYCKYYIDPIIIDESSNYLMY